jgi:hypothetical protein
VTHVTTTPPIHAPVIERKLKPDGSVREYPCELVHLAGGLAIIRFLMAKGGEIFGTPVVVPPGSVSYGFFWKARPYNLYRMKRADGSLIAHRFDALTDVRLSREVIEYRDLVLDWWVMPDDTILEEDRDELDAAIASGTMTAALQQTAAEATRQVYNRYRHIIDEAARWDAKLGFNP